MQKLTSRWRTASIVACSALIVGGTAVVPAQANDVKARYLGEMPGRTIAFENGMNARPSLAQLDTTGDGQADKQVFCVEPRTPTSFSVARGMQPLQKYGQGRADIKDPGRTMWVLQHGFPAVAAEQLAKNAGADVAGISAQRVEWTLAGATQAAVHTFASGTKVKPGFRWDVRSTPEGGRNSQLFTVVYMYLIKHATPAQVPGGGMPTWDNAPGQGRTQTLIEVPFPGGGGGAGGGGGGVVVTPPVGNPGGGDPGDGAGGGGGGDVVVTPPVAPPGTPGGGYGGDTPAGDDPVATDLRKMKEWNGHSLHKANQPAGGKPGGGNGGLGGLTMFDKAGGDEASWLSGISGFFRKLFDPSSWSL